MTLDQMQYYKAFCDLGSISKAAELHHISQPSMSHAIHKIQSECNTRLFTSNGKKLVLTQQGTALYAEITKFLERYEEFQHFVREELPLQAVLKVGYAPYLGGDITAAICGEFISRFPQTRIVTKDGVSKVNFDRLNNGECDVIISSISTPVDLSNYNLFEFEGHYDNYTYFCVNAAHPLASKDYVTMEEIAAVPLIMVAPPSGTTVRVLKRLEDLALMDRTSIQFTNQYSSVVNFVERNVACGFIPYKLAKKYDIIKPIPYESMVHYPLHCVWRKDAPQVFPLADFLRIARSFRYRDFD